MAETPLTAAEFAAMTPRQKGYAVYMLGARLDQPNIPESYEPAPEDRAEYSAGQSDAIIACIDGEE